MMSQVDELFHARHYQMNFYEFLEALARVAEKLSLVPLSQDKEKIPIEQRRLMLLHIKIEGLLLTMYYRLGEVIKKSVGDLFSDELGEFDSSILGHKKVS